MTKIPSEWFFRPRPLPLDEQGRVDFSKEADVSEDGPTNCYLISDPVRGKYLVSMDAHNRLGSVQEIPLETGGVVFVASSLSSGEEMSLYDENHNIFRLDKDGNVVWQVQREELGKIRWDRIMASVAKGDFGHSRKPFSCLYLLDSAGNDMTKTGQWTEGLRLFALSINYGGRYEIDIETGIATNITEPGQRDW